jgi:hypothetical protein
MTSVARQQIINKKEQTTAARERLGKHVPAARNTRMNCVVFVPSSYKEDNWGNQVSSVRESVKRGPERGN